LCHAKKIINVNVKFLDWLLVIRCRWSSARGHRWKWYGCEHCSVGFHLDSLPIVAVVLDGIG
jgi:hypothetical protein